MKELPGVSQVCQSQGVIPGKTSCLTHLREGCRTCSMSSTELRLAQGPEPDPWWAAEWDHLLGLPGAPGGRDVLLDQDKAGWLRLMPT